MEPGDSDSRCIAEWCHKWTHYGERRRGQCQKDAGHDGGHEWTDGYGRTVIWFGEAQKAPDVTRLRFGRWLESN